MSINHRVMEATAEQVWEVLADGWLYAQFVVGASRMRDVDPHWPAAGARLHHSVGVWPAILDDTTSVEEVAVGEMIRLRARGWPAGEASVTLTLRPEGRTTRVTIEEDVLSGPARLVPKPLRDVPLAWRNTETLRRLAYLAERRVD